MVKSKGMFELLLGGSPNSRLSCRLPCRGLALATFSAASFAAGIAPRLFLALCIEAVVE